MATPFPSSPVPGVRPPSRAFDSGNKVDAIPCFLAGTIVAQDTALEDFDMRIEAKTIWMENEAQSMDATSSDSTEQTTPVELSDFQNPVDILETYNPSDIFLGANDVFRLAIDQDQQKELAGNLRSGEVETPDGSLDGFELQDALQTKSRNLSVDPPQQFTDSNSDLENDVTNALNGDGAAFKSVEATFGFSQGPRQLYRRNDPGEVSAGDGGTPDGGTPNPKPDAGSKPDGGTPDAGKKSLADYIEDPVPAPPEYTPSDDDVEWLNLLQTQLYKDPDTIFCEPSGNLTEAGMRILAYGGGVTDGVRPDMQEAPPQQISPMHTRGYGVTDPTPEVDDPTTYAGDVKIPGPGGDPVNPDMQPEPPTDPGISGNDPY